VISDTAESLCPAHLRLQRAYPRGVTIFTRGDPGNSLFAVCSGTIRIAVLSPDGRDAVFNLIGEGEIFGEIALLDGKPRTADATAMTDSELLSQVKAPTADSNG